MANTKSAAKRARQSARRALRNRSVLSRLRGSQKKSLSAKPDLNQIRAAIAGIDRAAKRGIIHTNAARRRKAQLYRALAPAK